MSKILIPIIILISQALVFGQKGEVEILLNKSINSRTNLDSAVHFANKAYKNSIELNDPTSIANSKVCAGVSYYLANRRDTAINLLYEALPYLSSNTFLEGMAYWYTGKLISNTGDFDEALRKYHIALNSFTSVDSTKYIANIYNSIGVISGRQAKYTEAMDWFTKAYELKLSEGDSLETGSELNNIAIVYMRMDNFDKALELLWKSINLRNDDDDAGNYNTIGGIYNLKGKKDSALIYYQIAHDLASTSNNKYSEQISLKNISNVFYQQGNYQKAIETLKKSSYLEETNNGYMVGIGKNFHKMGMMDSAIFYLKSSLANSVNTRDNLILLESAEYLRQVYFEKGLLDSAYYYSDLVVQYKDSLNTGRLQDVFTNQRVKFETMEKEMAIKELKNKIAIQTAQQQIYQVVALSICIILLLIFLGYKRRINLKQKILEKEKQDLITKLENNRATLSAHTLSMIHNKNGLDTIQDCLKDLEGPEKQKIKNIISVNQSLNKDWENFQKYFNNVHTHFFDKLKKINANLSQKEMRLCALIKLGLTNKEVASLLNIEYDSVKMARYRLKKKLIVEEEIDLNDYLSKV